MEEQQRLFHFQMMKMHVKFWTFTEGFIKIAYDDTDPRSSFEIKLNIAGFLVEPIQGEGVYVPTEGYLAKAKALCAAHNVLLLTKCRQGSRTGRLLATCGNCSCTNGCENKPEVKADILILGKQFQVEFTSFSCISLTKL
jgi:ornithine--oxo-acid transaminase